MGDGAMANAVVSTKPREPFKVRAELLAPERLAPNVQSLLATRSRAIEELADQSLAVVLATAKWFIASGHSETPRVGVIGGGAVGCAVLMKLLVHAYPSDRLALSTRQPERLPKCEALQSPAALALFGQVTRHDDNARLARKCDVVVLCVPPSQLKGVALQIKFAAVERSQGGNSVPLLIVSALCGVSRESIAKSCGSRAVVRIQVMPPAPMEHHYGNKGSRRALEAIVTALSALDAGGDASSSAELVDSDGQSAKAARVRTLLLASSPSTDEHAAPAIQWPTDWQRQLKQRLLVDVKHASPLHRHSE